MGSFAAWCDMTPAKFTNEVLRWYTPVLLWEHFIAPEKIAMVTGRSASTISRELKRNALPKSG